MLKKIIIISIVALAIYKFLFAHHKHVTEVTVAIGEVRLAQIAPTVSVIGNVIAEQSVDISSKISGVIKTISFQSGQKVKKGDVLVEFENDDIKALLDQKIAKLNLAKQTYDRYASLVKKGSISHAEFDKVSSEFETARAEVNYQTALYNQTFIRAPFDGKIGIRAINLGQFISPGQAIANLQSCASMYVDFHVPERYIQQVKENAEITLMHDDLTVAHGRVIALHSNLSLETRTLQVRALIDKNFSETLYPGMDAEVNLSLSKVKSSLVIPQSAIVYSPMGEYVYKSFHHQIEKIKVETGERFGNDVVILTGLKIGDKVICAGQIKLHPGVTTREVPYDSRGTIS